MPSQELMKFLKVYDGQENIPMDKFIEFVNSFNNVNRDEQDEFENKAVEVINVVSGLTPTQIKYVFDLVNYSVYQSPTQIKFFKKKCEYTNPRTMNT